MKMVLFTLTLVRHGETVANRKNIIQGQQNTPLSETGEQQARLLAGRLRDENFSHVFTSDLSRAAKTAEMIVENNRVNQCDIVYDPRLRERKFGNVEGKTYKELVAAAKKSNTAPGDFCPKGSENIKQLRQRAVTFFQELCEKLRCYSTQDEGEHVPGSIKRRITSHAESQHGFSMSSFSSCVPMNKVVGPSGGMEDDIDRSQVKRPRHGSVGGEMDSDSGRVESSATNSSEEISSESQAEIARSNSSSSSGYSSLQENPELTDCDTEQFSPHAEPSHSSAQSRESTPCDIDSLFHPVVVSDAESKSHLSTKSREMSRSDCPNISLSPLLEHRLSSISSISSGRNSSFDDGDGLTFSVADVLVVGHGGFMKELIRHFIEDLGCKVPGGKGHALRVSPNTGLSKFIVTTDDESSPAVITCLLIHDKDHLLNMIVPQENLSI